MILISISFYAKIMFCKKYLSFICLLIHTKIKLIKKNYIKKGENTCIYFKQKK